VMVSSFRFHVSGEAQNRNLMRWNGDFQLET